jgi:hypothetical protein
MPHAAVMSQWPKRTPAPEDVIVLWNRHPNMEPYLQPYERAGAAVLIAENGYFGRNWRGGVWYSLARGQHNGAGTWPTSDGARWRSFGITVPPWNTSGQELVILAQRGIGSAAVRQPQGWVERLAGELRARTRRRVRIRAHPGPQNAVPRVSLEQDLRDAWAAITWGSSAGLKAIAAGVPVFFGMPAWIGGSAARSIDHDLEDRFLGDPLPMLERLADALWSLDEIESGEALRRYMSSGI